MQVLENEIKGKVFTLRVAGDSEPVIRYPRDLMESLGFKTGKKGGTRFQSFYNHKGEILLRPVAVSPANSEGGSE